jgi:hypothetical protein
LRYAEEQAVVDFAKRINLAVVNTFFKKQVSHPLTYTSRGRQSQIDYTLYHWKHLGDKRTVK